MLHQSPKRTRLANRTTLNTGGTATLTTTGVAPDGADHVLIDVILGSIHDSGGLTVLKLEESDSLSTGYEVVDHKVFTNGMSFGVGSGSNASPALPGGTDDNKVWTFEVDMAQGRKKYLRVVATTATAQDTIIDAVMMYEFQSHRTPVSSNGATQQLLS